MEQPLEEIKEIQQTTGPTELQDLIAPSALQISSNNVQLGGKFVRTIFIVNYPRFLSVNWLTPIINFPAAVDISMFIHPVDVGELLKKLKKKLTEIESQISMEQEKGKVRDPMLETARHDIESLRNKLVQGTEKFFKYSLYITIYANSLKDLDSAEQEITAFLDARMINTKVALFQQADGLNSTFPLGEDRLFITNSMNSAPLSTSFPFVSSTLTSNKGILYGINRHNNSLVLFDRFSLENANMVVFGKAGGGKSVKGDSPVLIKNKGEIQLIKIGPLVEKMIKKQGATQIDKELEGVIDPKIEVYSFNKGLKGEWSKVTVAARKKAPEIFYKFKTRSGREITTTADHNIVLLKNGQVGVSKSSEIKKGDHVPLPKSLMKNSFSKNSLDLFSLLKNKFIYVKGSSFIIEQNYQTLKQREIDPRFDKYLYKYRIGRIIPIQYFNKILRVLNIDYKTYQRKLQITSKSGKYSLPILWPITPELLRILGYITSEGTITDRAIYITNSDSEILQDTKRCFEKLEVPYYFGNRGIVTAARTFIEIVKALKGGKYSSEKRVFPFIFQVKTRNISHFLKAYFEGDGGIEDNKSITATSKSEKLISEITYLLYYFGIIARISKTKKKATNSSWKRKRTYFKLVISGQDNLKKFAENINFISQKKRKLLSQTIQKQGNTNVDVVPETRNIFNEIYQLFKPQLYGIPEISEWKRGKRNPSPQHLIKVINKIEERIEYFKNLTSTFKILNEIPSLASIIDLWKTNKELNGMQPGSNIVFKTAETISGNSYSLKEIKSVIQQGFKEMSLPVKEHSRSLQSALVARPESNTRYEIIENASHFIWKNYQKLLNKIPQIEEKLNRLKILANSDLFWDPVVEIKTEKNKKEKYVYDLTVDNEVFLAGQGGMFVHNSYATKLEVLRSLMFGLDVIIIDPENEYQYLAETVGGAYVKISLNSPHHINPFDLSMPGPEEKPEDILRGNVIELTGLLKLIFGKLTAEEESILDRALVETYASRDITPQSDFKTITPPLLGDLTTILEGMEGGGSMAKKLEKYTEGSFSGFLNQPTNIDIVDKNLVLFSIRDMEEELRPVAMYVILHYIWNLIRSKLKKRILIVDEAWWLMKYEEGGSFLHGIAKRCRKYFLGLTTITQDIPDFMESSYGKPIITNSSIQMLFKQSPATIDIVKKTFNLTDEEKYLLLESGVGEGIFFAGLKHVAIKVVASYTEDQIITSNPEQLLQIEKAKEELARAEAEE